MQRGGSGAYDAVVVGAGPNGLAAAITLARAGLSVLVLEAAREPGGALRSEALTLPGFVHDVGSAVHPLGAASPFFASLPLAEHGLRWVEPPVALAHPFDDGTAAVLTRDLAATRRGLDRSHPGDGARYAALVGPFARRWDQLARDALAPLHLPTHPLLLAGFGLHAIQPAAGLARGVFRGEGARALFAAIAAHASVPLTQLGTAAFGLVLAVAAHRVGWPVPAGGAGAFARALVAYLERLGGRVVTNAPVRALGDLPNARAVLLDLTPRQLLALGGLRLPDGYRRRLEHFGYGPAVFKVDYALDAPAPWTARECHRAGTLHLGGPLDEVAASEDAVWRGEHAERPLVLAAQPSVFDPSRAPAGRHTLWAYCHVPAGSPRDALPALERQIERFAPGFRDRVLARHVMGPSQLEAWDANLVGGTIGGGANTLGQLYFRPAVRRVPYATPVPGLYLCSSSTPPGGGVHGLCGHHAAAAALRERFGGGAA